MDPSNGLGGGGVGGVRRLMRLKPPLKFDPYKC